MKVARASACGGLSLHPLTVVVLCLVGVCLEGICLTQRPENADDFRALYRAAQLVGTTGGVYSHATSLPNTNQKTWFLPFVRTPFYALLIKPLTALPYPAARAVWLALIAIALAALIPLFPGPRDKLALALSFSLPVTYAAMLGQDIAFIVLIAFSAGRLAASGKEFQAGLAASLLAIKPTYLLPAGIVFLAKTRRGTYGIVLGTAIQLAVSFLLEGPHWPSGLLAMLRDPRFDMVIERMLNVRAMAASLGLPPEVYILASIALLVWLWEIARRMDLRDALIAALPLGMLASPHSYVYDAVVLIPLLVRALSDTSQRVLLTMLALTPIPYAILMTHSGPHLLAGSTMVVVTTASAVYAFQSSNNMVVLKGRAAQPYEEGPRLL
jgi:hypothetical protein